MLGFEGVWQGTAILYDRDTGSVWMHFTGACFDGPRAGRTLRALPTGVHTTWAAWRHDHPDTDVMAPDPRFAPRYLTRDQARSGDPHVPSYFEPTIAPRDPRLPLSELLLGVRVDAEARAYPLARLAATSGVVEETLAGTPISVWYDADARTACAFDARLDGRTLAFERRADGFHDLATGTRFDLAGRGVDGPLSGRTLTRVPSLLCEWFGWFAHHPSTTIVGS